MSLFGNPANDASSPPISIFASPSAIPPVAKAAFPSKSPGLFFGKPTREDMIRRWISKSFNNPELSDVTIHLGDVKLSAHSSVLASQSEYFAKALTSRFQEGSTRQFKFSEGSMQAYWRVFQYMYTGTYSDIPAVAALAKDDDDLVKDIMVYSLADYFIIDTLKEHALGRFKEKIQRQWSDDRFINCIHTVYDSTSEADRTLKDAVVQVCGKHMKTLWQKETFQDLCRKEGQFAVDVISKILQEGLKPPGLQPTSWVPKAPAAASGDSSAQRPRGLFG